MQHRRRGRHRHVIRQMSSDLCSALFVLNRQRLLVLDLRLLLLLGLLFTTTSVSAAISAAAPEISEPPPPTEHSALRC